MLYARILLNFLLPEKCLQLQIEQKQKAKKQNRRMEQKKMTKINA